jgi:hypothetical protein
MRAGLELEGRHYRTDSASNYLGTFIFPNGESFLNGRPRNFTQRIGDPLIVYSHLEGGAYVQDDLRLRPNLTFSPGLRYELQTHVRDLTGFGPRLGLTWAPGKNGGTTIRTSYGIFYNWLGTNIYEQTLRVDGVRQREINIENPSFPNPGGDATISASNKYVLGDIHMERIHRFSAAIDRAISRKLRASLSLRDGAVSQPAARRESQCPGARRASRSVIRQHHRGDIGRSDGNLRAGPGLEHQFCRWRPQCRSGEVESAQDDGAVQLPASPRLQQHRRRLQRVAERLA